MKNFISAFKELKIVNFLFLTLAGIINAFGVVVFLAPVKLYDSGISGTSMLISQETPAWCSLSLILILLNIPLRVLTKEEEQEQSLPSGQNWSLLSEEQYQNLQKGKKEKSSHFAALEGLFDEK